MLPSILAFLVLVLAFAWGALTPVNAGLIALVAAYGVGGGLGGLGVAQVTALFPVDLFVILLGTTLLFSLLRLTGGVDLLAAWAERLAGGRRRRVPVLMFALAAILATAGAFTPAAVAIVAPVALALGARFGISALAMGLVTVQGANAGAFSPANPFGVLANRMLEGAGAPAGGLALWLNCFLFNAAIAAMAYAVVQGWTGGADRVPPPEAGAAPGAPPAPDPLRGLGLLAILALLVLTLGFRLDVGVAALCASLVLIAARPGLQGPALQGVAWPAILLVTGIVTYVGVLERLGAVAALQSGLSAAGDGAMATLVTCYGVGLVSAFASTTGMLGALMPVVVPLAADPLLTPIGVVTAVAIAASAVDVSPMSTSGALLLASARPEEAGFFFRALLVYAAAMIALVPLLAWLVFVRSGLF